MVVSTAGKAQTLRYQSLVNKVMRGLLRVPLLSRLIGKRIVVLDIVGRKSGAHYSIPVVYTRHEGKILVCTPFAWGRNLRTGDRIAIRLAGRLVPADVEAFADEADVVKYYTVMCRDNHGYAKFNRVGIRPDGTPDPGDLQLAWTYGGRAFLLSPR
jgi:hypothetical protein